MSSSLGEPAGLDFDRAAPEKVRIFIMLGAHSLWSLSFPLVAFDAEDPRIEEPHLFVGSCSALGHNFIFLVALD